MKKQPLQIVVFFLLSIFYCNTARSAHPNIRFRHISHQQGLSQSTALSTVQDATGYMWFATLDGLNKYDGRKFTIFRPDAADTNSISDLGLRKLFVDQSGNLWVISLSGKLDRFSDENEHFANYEVWRNDLNKNAIFIDMAEDRQGNFWAAATPAALFKYHPDSDQFEPFEFLPEVQQILSGLHLQTILFDEHFIWLGTWEGLFRYHLVKKSVQQFSENDGPIGKTVFALSKDLSDNIWVGTSDGGISVYNNKKNIFQHFQHRETEKASLSSNRVVSLFCNSQGQIWAGTVDGGLNLFNSKNQNFTRYQHNSAWQASLSSGAVTDIFEDRNGGMWVGSYGGGVNYFNPAGQIFHHITEQTGNSQSLPNKSVLSVLETKNGDLFIGTDGGGLTHIDQSTNEYQHYLQNKTSGGSNSITALLEDQSGKIWVAADPGNDSPAGQILQFDPLKKSFSTFQKVPLTLGSITAFLQDRSGNIWMGSSSDGLFCYHPASGRVDQFKYSSTQKNGISGNAVYSLLEDSCGKIWIGTLNRGLNIYDPATGKFTNFTADAANPRSLAQNSVWCIAEDHQQNIWLGSWGGGLQKFEPADSTFHTFTIKEGLPSNIIYSILSDLNGYLWLGTNQGLCKFDPQNYSVQIYNYATGLPMQEFNQGAAFPAKNGFLYFGGTDGITWFHPNQLQHNIYQPPIVITKFSVFNQPRQIQSGTPITLSYHENFFAFEFAALDFTAPENNQYAYQLRGVDADWVQAGNRNFASYTNIAPGKYIFRVKGANNDGQWNETPLELSLYILPPFWQTWWFRILIILLLAFSLYQLHRLRLQKLLAIERTRNHIARDLHDDVSATLTGILYFSDAISRDPDTRKNPLLHKTIGLIKESAADAQEAMSDIIWSINPENDRWETILPKFRRFTSDLCDSNGIIYQLDIPDSAPEKPLSMEERRNIWLIYKEIIINAIKHANGQELTVIIKFDPAFFLTISDDGVGFDPKNTNEGNGVRNIYQRAQNLKGTAKLQTAPGEGSKWQIKIPLS